MLLSGHGGEVFSVKFSPDGKTVASGSHDKHIFLWNTYGECQNFMMLKGMLFNSFLKRVFSAQSCPEILFETMDLRCSSVAVAGAFGALEYPTCLPYIQHSLILCNMVYGFTRHI